MATGTGKTVVAFQICWKLWTSAGTATGEHRRPRILYLADRNILVDDPKDKTFAPFRRRTLQDRRRRGQRRAGRCTSPSTRRSPRTSAGPGSIASIRPDFFDLIIVDECHRGSASDESNWREILEYFEPAFQLGMTATPLREDNRDTYRYFGNPIYTYSLRQGIDDGFLAPYRVHRVDHRVGRRRLAARARASSTATAARSRTRSTRRQDFERVVALRARTEAIARTPHRVPEEDGPLRQDHRVLRGPGARRRDAQALNNLNTDLVQQYPDYVCRVTADEGDIGTRPPEPLPGRRDATRR